MNHRTLAGAENVRKQLEGIERKVIKTSYQQKTYTDPSYYMSIRKALTAGFYMQVAHCESTKTYLTVKDQQVCSRLFFIMK